MVARPLCYIPQWCFPRVGCTCPHGCTQSVLPAGTTPVLMCKLHGACARGECCLRDLSLWCRWKDRAPGALILIFLTSHGMEGLRHRFWHFPGLASCLLNYPLPLWPPDLVCRPTSKLELIIIDNFRISYSSVLKKKNTQSMKKNKTKTQDFHSWKSYRETTKLLVQCGTDTYLLSWHRRIQGDGYDLWSLKVDFNNKHLR